MSVYIYQIWKHVLKFPTFLFFFILKRRRINASPIFIVACAHSGTSVVHRIIGTHSRIFPIPFPSGIAAHPLRRFLPIYFDYMTLANGKSRWIEKTARNIKHIDRLLKIRNAKVILMLRDGRDVAYSIKRRTGSMERGIDRWVDNNLQGQKYWDHDRVYLLKYEDLIVNTEHVLKNVFEFIDENFEKECLDYYKKPAYFQDTTIEKPKTEADRDHNKLRNWQINQPLFDGRNKWKVLDNNDKNIIKKKGGHLLIEYGYANDNSW